ncbi:hypothetical protein OG948_59440 (plasmid) [Embleya sp. NBC_00888]|uniref:GP88 family protein n=1 Tax=Embleya sp. NBC_00888 TaxID=2975960 RepID=UPI00386668BE|nr:hypothetical protein OG948_59440 [Embleya sp. NBC_00888]
MRQQGIWNWTLPAWAGRLPSGRTYNTCPSAGICAHICYARAGAYRFPSVLARHEMNLEYVLDDLSGWEHQMGHELLAKRFLKSWVRIHDAGDFFSDEYLKAWLRIIQSAPEHVNFYAYTKEVSRFRELVDPRKYPRFRYVFSLGGVQDHLLDLTVEPHADVFPDAASVRAHGYTSQASSDLIAVSGRIRIGITANRHRHLQRIQGERSFGALQRQQRAAARDRHGRRCATGRRSSACSHSGPTAPSPECPVQNPHTPPQAST